MKVMSEGAVLRRLRPLWDKKLRGAATSEKRLNAMNVNLNPKRS
jgi:hypothetical protein